MKRTVCRQPRKTLSLTGQEDCLLLNIFVPSSAFDNANVSLPVMVWIHGGSFIVGSNQPSSYGPSHFMDRDVIVVLVNYRLGPLGFLSLGTEDVPGNAGLRDQTMAFQWVNENIASFGGDPSRITIFGESAGSLSVGLHLLSPLSEGITLINEGQFFDDLYEVCINMVEKWDKMGQYRSPLRCNVNRRNP